MGLLATVGKAISSSFAAFSGGSPIKVPDSKPYGGDGIQAYGGFLVSDELRPELTGQLKWLTYSNSTNIAIVATGLRRTLDMLAGTTWHAEPNKAGGADAERGAEIVTKGLLEARMSRPWSTIVRKAALYRYYGFSLHEWSAARSDAAKQVVFTDIAHRPQYTIDRWDKPSEQEPWQAVGQMTRAGNRFVIPRERLFHCVDDTLTDSPDGVGLLRHVIELVRRLGILEGLEGLAYETDLRGMPIGRAPLGELSAAAKSTPGLTAGQVDAFIATKTQVLRSALAGIVKTPDRLQHLLLDSATYQGADQNTISQIQKWALELLKGNSNGVAEVAAAIARVQLEIARVLGVEFVMMGGTSSGSHAMHGSKTDFFGRNLQTILNEVGQFATRDLAYQLVGLNGLDPETCTPTLVAEPIDQAAVLETCQALAALATAGLQPDDEALLVIRERMHLPAPPKPTPAMMGALGLGRSPVPGQPTGSLPGQPVPGQQPTRPGQSGAPGAQPAGPRGEPTILRTPPAPGKQQPPAG